MDFIRAARAAAGCSVMVVLGGGCLVPATGEAVAPPSAPPPRRTVPFKPRTDCEGMAEIPGGTLSSLGGQRHSAIVQPFCMDKTEVSVAEYEACAAAGRCSPAASKPSGGERETGESCNGGAAGRESHPINCVNWEQAKTYCEAVGGKLPSEEEWEWAARGGDKGSKFPWGDAAVGPQVCWGPGRKSTCPVGSFPAGDNPWGVHDLSGNVGEWTTGVFWPGEPTVVGSGGRIVRGGGYAINGEIAPWQWLFASQGAGIDPRGTSWHIGFRCVTAPRAGTPPQLPPISVEEKARWKLYTDKSTGPLYLEYLARYPQSPYACSAHYNLNQNGKSGELVKVAQETPVGSVECNPTSDGKLSQSFAVSHQMILGKKWIGRCPEKVQIGFDVKNPSEAAMLVEGRYGGPASYSIVPSKGSSRVTVNSACRASGDPQVSISGGTATLTWTKCQWSGGIRLHSVGAEVKAGKPLLDAASHDSAAAIQFVEANPTSELTYALVGLILAERRTAVTALAANVSASIKEGTRSSEVDPLPYTAKVQNKNKSAVTVRVALENGVAEDWELAAGAQKDSAQTTPAGGKPVFRVLSVRIAGASRLMDGSYSAKAPLPGKMSQIPADFAVLRTADGFLAWLFATARPWPVWTMETPVAVAVYRGTEKGDVTTFAPIGSGMRTCGHEDTSKFGAVLDAPSPSAFTATLGPNAKGSYSPVVGAFSWTPRD
jgi:formylglycine-generating enzyme required for sulfatase activity